MKGKLFGKDGIVTFKKETNGDFQFITEIASDDGNDHKKAVMRNGVRYCASNVKRELKFLKLLNF